MRCVHKWRESGCGLMSMRHEASIMSGTLSTSPGTTELIVLRHPNMRIPLLIVLVLSQQDITHATRKLKRVKEVEAIRRCVSSDHEFEPCTRLPEWKL